MYWGQGGAAGHNIQLRGRGGASGYNIIKFFMGEGRGIWV